MIELLASAALASFPAPECPVAFERKEEVRLVLVKRASELSLAAGAPLPASSLLHFDATVWVTLSR